MLFIQYCIVLYHRFICCLSSSVSRYTTSYHTGCWVCL